MKKIVFNQKGKAENTVDINDIEFKNGKVYGFSTGLNFHYLHEIVNREEKYNGQFVWLPLFVKIFPNGHIMYPANTALAALQRAVIEVNYEVYEFENLLEFLEWCLSKIKETQIPKLDNRFFFLDKIRVCFNYK